MTELAEILRQHGAQYRAKYGDKMLPSHRQAMRAIERCRTPALGGHVYYCPECIETEYQQQSQKRRWLSHWELAGIVLTHVCGGCPIDLGTARQQRDALAQLVHLVGTGHYEHLVGQIALMHRLQQGLSNRFLRITNDDNLLGGS